MKMALVKTTKFGPKPAKNIDDDIPGPGPAKNKSVLERSSIRLN
jgi:hypothetical protein